MSDTTAVSPIHTAGSAIDVPRLVADQRAYFHNGATLSADFRIDTLRRLHAAIASREKAIFEALHADLRKCEAEAYLGEVAVSLDEIKFTIKQLRGWMKPRRVRTPLALWPASSRVHADPHGVCLIIAPWNYPFQLAIAPLIGAIAAGNTAIVKPSEVSPATSQLLAELIDDTFDAKHVAAIQGGVDVSTALLEQRFDHIFFTGSTAVGKIVMKAAAEHLTPVVLELGGKSPCFVDDDTDLETASRRIAWGKFINAGQTCIAPDYLLVRREVKDQLITQVKARIAEFYGDDPAASADYPRIISDRHFDRLVGLLDQSSVAVGGAHEREQRYIEPTIIDPADWDDAIMADEIFGPLLPVMEYERLDDAISRVNERPKPLALYFFGGDERRRRKVLRETTAGGVCVNDTLMHVLSPYLPFGGVGPSGLGNYHGRASFDAFTHYKSVLTRGTWLDLPIRYAPFNANKLAWMRRLMG